jgi:hypothetical protein
MRQASLDNVYREIMLLSDSDRQKLYQLMEKELYKKNNIVAYTTSGKPLTKSEYIEQINIGLRQIKNGEMVTDEELRIEMETW